MSNITLNSKTYTDSGIDADRKHVWIEQSAGVVAGFSPLTGRVKLANGTKEKTRVVWVLKVPALIGSDSACGCEGNVKNLRYFNIEYVADPSVSATERADDLARLKDLVLTTEFGNSVTSLQQP